MTIKKCGFVAIIGATNAGKSTLLNYLLGKKLAAVSRKVNTTRQKIKGVYNHENVQIIFVDTPGFSNHPQNITSQEIAPEASAESDKTILMLDAVKLLGNNDEFTLKIINDTARMTRPIILINKIDLVKRTDLLLAIDKLNKLINPDAVFIISAERGDGISDLIKYLASVMPEGEHLFYKNSDLSDEAIVNERLREHIYDMLHDELPYTVEPETESISRGKNGSLTIRALLKVQEARQKPMLIGKNGEVLRRIGTRARLDLSEFMQRPVNLFLTVKVV